MIRSQLSGLSLLACALTSLGATKVNGQDGAAAPRPAANRASTDANRAARLEKPAPHAFKDGVPVGLYFMTRFWASSGALEKAAWYFAPDGTVYRNLEDGFSAADLARHKGRKGTCRADGNLLHVTWADGRKTTSKIERREMAFSWDAGIFTAVKPFGDAPEISGRYEGGESLSVGGNRAAVSKRLELRRDGTFRWSGVSFLSSSSETTSIAAGSTGGDSTGTWRIESHALLLTDAAGVTLRRIAFPYDDEKTPLKPDRIFFGGTLYNKQKD